MTLRQLYYQLVARAIKYGVYQKGQQTGTEVFENKPANYSKLSDLLSGARLCGLIDWEFIEDRVRVPKYPNEFDNIPDLIDVAIRAYRRQRWADQDCYVEVWVEKDALSGVLEPITNEYHVRLLVNRGYSSVTAMHDAALRFKQAERNGKECHLLYFGDHDPSGEDMVRDIDNRLNEIFGCDVTVNKVALTMEQIRQYNPPPNPAKMTDSRAEGYVAEHGRQSWELDALPPDVLVSILRSALNQVIDMKKYKAIKAKEEEEKNRLRRLADKHFEKGNGSDDEDEDEDNEEQEEDEQ